MREKELRELINYRMQRAMDTLEEVRVMASMIIGMRVRIGFITRRFMQ